MLIIDSHAHVYSHDEWSFPARPDARRPGPGIGSVGHLARICNANGIDAAVSIQTWSFYGWDNRYLAHVSRSEPEWIAGVCAVDPEDPASPERLSELVRNHGVRGVRVLTVTSGHLDIPEVRALIARATDLGIVVNVLTSPAHADELDGLLAAYPSTSFVIEHALSINRSRDRGRHLDALRRIARRQNAVVELCDLPACSHERPPFADAQPLFLQILDAFGPERCVWGSCFPMEVWVPGVDPGEALAVFASHLAIPDTARADILGRTAARLWFPQLLAADGSSRIHAEGSSAISS